jgi:hypothetical protein
MALDPSFRSVATREHITKCYNRLPLAEYCGLGLWRHRAGSASVPSLKPLEFRRRSVGCFSRRERSAHICVIRVERAMRKNSQLAAAREGCVENGPAAALLVGYVSFRYAPSYRQSGSDRLAGGPFCTQRNSRDLRDGTLGQKSEEKERN